MIVKEQKIVRLFAVLPIYSQYIRENNKTWKFLGLPLLKIWHSADKTIKKYYFLGMPMIKIKEKVTETKNG